MDRMQIAVVLALRELGLEPLATDDYGKKKDALYLANAAGVNAGNYFWYWHYRGSVAADGVLDDFFTIWFSVTPEFDETAGWQLDDKSTAALTRMNPLIKDSDLELLASTHFLIKHGHSTREIPEILWKYEGNYSVQRVRKARSELRRYGLLSS